MGSERISNTSAVYLWCVRVSGHAVHVRPGNRPTTARYVAAHLRRNINPVLGDLPMRTIPAPQVELDELAAHLTRHPTDGLLFPGADGGPIVRTRFNDAAWRPALKAARVTSVTFHDLRHFYASALIRGGLSVRVVADRLGHADAGLTLNVYSHLWPDEEDRTRVAVDALLGALADSARTEQAP